MPGEDDFMSREQKGIPIKTEIFYFSGTGNSLFVARELAKRIQRSRVIPIALVCVRTSSGPARMSLTSSSPCMR